MTSIPTLTEQEYARLAVAARREGVSVEEWIAYSVRCSLALHERLGARIPAEGGLGR